MSNMDTSAFKPGATSAAAGSAPAAPAGGEEEVSALKAELARLQEKIDKLGK